MDTYIYTPSVATQHAKEFHGHFDCLHPKTLSMKNRHYNRKVRELLAIDIVVVRYEQDDDSSSLMIDL